MKFTSKELANAMGLKVGDKIKLRDTIFEVTEDLGLKEENLCISSLLMLVDTKEDFEILPPKKKVGDMLCKEIENCSDCPLRGICDTVDNRYTLYEILEDSKAKREDKELYDFLKARLDKEVEI